MNKETVVELLFEMYQNRGFVTTDEILNACDEAELSVFDTDYVSNKLIEKGALVTDEQPLTHSDVAQSNEEELTDYSQTDYSEIFRYFNSNYPNMRFVIDYIKSAKPLQHGEMSQLITQMRSGNIYAREIAFRKNMRLALKETYKYREKTLVSLEDVFQQACISVLKAIDSYDQYIHSAFTSYCNSWVFQGIERYLMDFEDTIRIPVHLHEKINKVRKIENESIYSSYSELIRIVAKYMEITFNGAKELVDFYFISNTVSLDEIFEKSNSLINDNSQDDLEEKELSSWTIISDEYAYECVQNRLNAEYVSKILGVLSPREAQVLRLRYGFDGSERTLEEVGNILNVTRERIRQIEAKAFRKIRKHQKMIEIMNIETKN